VHDVAFGEAGTVALNVRPVSDVGGISVRVTSVQSRLFRSFAFFSNLPVTGPYVVVPVSPLVNAIGVGCGFAIAIGAGFISSV
jgi:hypothetical protein